MNEAHTRSGWGWPNLVVGILGVSYSAILLVFRESWRFASDLRPLLPFVILALVPLIVGLVLLRSRSRPHGYAWLGITGLLLGIVGLVGTEHRRSLVHERRLMVSCKSNMCIIDGAKEQWAMAKNVPEGTVPITNEVLQYIKGGVLPVCPVTRMKTYNLGKIDEDPSCPVHGSSSRMHLPDGTMPWQW